MTERPIEADLATPAVLSRSSNTRWAQITDPDQRLLAIRGEARGFLEEHGSLGSTALRINGRRDLLSAIDRYYPDHLSGLQRDLGLRVRPANPKNHWSNETIESESLAFLQLHGVITPKKLVEMGRTDLLGAINARYPGRLTGLKQNLNIEPGRRPDGYFIEENIERKLRAIIERTGEFPSYNVIREIDSTLTAVLSRTGGFGYWRQKLGFEIKERPNGFWTEETIRDEATKFVQEGNGLSGKELKAKNMGALAHAISKSYPGGIRQLQQDLGIKDERQMPGYWTPQRILEAALQIHTQEGDLSLSIVNRCQLWGLASSIRKHYPGGINRLKIDIGVLLQTAQVSPDQANEQLTKLLEGAK